MSPPGDTSTVLEHNGSSSELTLPQKHPMYWFDDGSIIIRVENTLFKLHLTLISRHSAYFSAYTTAHLFSRGEAPTGLKLFNQCDDEIESSGYLFIDTEHSRGVVAADMVVLLEHLYHDVPLTSNASLDRVASILRITSPQQLDFPRLHEHAKDLFGAMFPAGPTPFSYPHPLHDALTLATDFDIPSVRKALLYSLVTTTHFDTEDMPELSPVDDVMDPPRQTSLVTAPAAPISIQHTAANVESDPIAIHMISTLKSQAQRRTLTPSDVELCRRLMTKLIDHFTPTLFTPAATPHMACTDVFADTWMSLVIQPALEDDGVYKPLETLERIKGIDWATHGLCPACVIEKREEWTEEQYIVWRLMDEWLESNYRIS
ncbi:hypothetical protein BDQ12DRAFT_691944 [Crucibulum laeve]|uniref:BTB domain-containing protein n=1 Tax=Crucibulum laeve TaxID=68775 RepID=A0A5C3LVQ4_9AGAR|nr:hypothetical protein BDQ12DRAFT_691944 [Crucibulum laeve]